MTSNEITITSEKEYNINKFYIGELYLTTNINSRFQSSKLLTKKELLKNGAIEINLDISLLTETNYRKGVKYYRLLTIYYESDKGYLCLHNGNIYQKNGEDFCNNLVPLPILLPKISYDISKKIDINKVLITFNQLFSRMIPLETIYKKDKYNIEDYYIGTLVLYTGLSQKNKIIMTNPTSIYSKYILSKSTTMICKSNNNCKVTIPPNNNIVLGNCNYTHYKCLFLKTSNGMYSINNFDMFESTEIEENSFKPNRTDKSYCSNLEPLVNKIKEKK